jgi:isatin hydrolase
LRSVEHPGRFGGTGESEGVVDLEQEAVSLAVSLAASGVVDLSLTLSDDAPCSWPGAFPFRHFPDHWFEEVDGGVSALHTPNGAPYRSHALMLDEHTGTHFDAPAHFIPPSDSGLPGASPAGDITGDRVDLAQLMGPAVVIDVRGLVGTAADGVSPRIAPADVTAWEDVHGPVTAGEIVLFQSGWDARYQRGPSGQGYVSGPLVAEDSSAWPAPSPETISLLLERGVRCVGTDGPSMGPADDGVPTHVVGLGAGMLYVECLAGLDRLPGRGATFVFLPLKVARSSGGPGRAIAFVPVSGVASGAQ